jgi:hypothetical protein
MNMRTSVKRMAAATVLASAVGLGAASVIATPASARIIQFGAQQCRAIQYAIDDSYDMMAAAYLRGDADEGDWWLTAAQMAEAKYAAHC